jgi:hypothetical protein
VVPAAGAVVVVVVEEEGEVEGFLALSVIERLREHTPSSRRELECGPCTAHHHPRWKR